MRQRAAGLWRRILTSDPDAIFGPEASRLLNRGPADRLAQPGYMGQRYRPGGLVFVSMNPGPGPLGGLNPADQLQYKTLEALRDADDSAVCARFDEVTEVLADIMPGWHIHRNFVTPVLEAWKLNFSEVAYVNLLKWRITSSSGLARLYKLSWDDHTRGQLELLAPSRVIAIGTDAGRAFQRHCKGSFEFDFIPRHFSNVRYGTGRAALARITGSNLT
ncbi:MAG: hypothetical protein ACRD7E_25595 [Bryobacteraceae bacterium]